MSIFSSWSWAPRNHSSISGFHLGIASRSSAAIGLGSTGINDQWRICFVWRGADTHEVEIADYH